MTVSVNIRGLEDFYPHPEFYNHSLSLKQSSLRRFRLSKTNLGAPVWLNNVTNDGGVMRRVVLCVQQKLDCVLR
jgi:hypothetical protein